MTNWNNVLTEEQSPSSRASELEDWINFITVSHTVQNTQQREHIGKDFHTNILINIYVILINICNKYM